MKKFHVYNVYLDDGKSVFKEVIPAPSKKEAIDYCEGNGYTVAVHDCDLRDIDLQCLADTLERNGWGKQEIAVITRCLDFCGLRRD